MSEATDIIDGHLDADFTRDSTRGPTSVFRQLAAFLRPGSHRHRASALARVPGPNRLNLRHRVGRTQSQQHPDKRNVATVPVVVSSGAE